MKLKPLLTVIFLSVIGLVVNKILFYLFVPKIYEDAFVYALPLLYAFFGISSVIIVGILLKVKQRSINNVGFTFLLLTSVKMVLAYLFVRPILAAGLPKTPTEKMTFFIIFGYFLAVETIVTIRILNNKQ